MIDPGIIGQELIQRGWSQGSLLNLAPAYKMYLAVENLTQNRVMWGVRKDPMSENELFIIISQPCDIQKSPVYEPFVEVMRVFKTNERKIIHDASRNSVRYFLLSRTQIENGAVEALIVESTIHLTLDKPSLLSLTPLSTIQDEVTLRLFRRWLAQRYERPALEDSLVNAIQKPVVKAIDKLRPTHPLQSTLDGIGEVLFLLVNETQPYQIIVLFIRSDRSDTPQVSEEQVAELAGWMSTVLDKGGHAAISDWRLLGTDEISVRDYANAYRLPLDQYSLGLDND